MKLGFSLTYCLQPALHKKWSFTLRISSFFVQCCNWNSLFALMKTIFAKTLYLKSFIGSEYVSVCSKIFNKSINWTCLCPRRSVVFHLKCISLKTTASQSICRNLSLVTLTWLTGELMLNFLPTGIAGNGFDAMTPCNHGTIIVCIIVFWFKLLL